MKPTQRRQETTARRPAIAALPPPDLASATVTSRELFGRIVESGYPLPPGKGHYRKVLLAMQPGESTVVRIAEMVNWHNCAKKAGLQVTCRKIDDVYTRMWRVS